MKLLLHICCAPCSVYPTGLFKEEGIDFEGLYFNPNIHPVEEFNRRKETLEKYASMENIKVHYRDDFQQKTWEEFEGPGEERCAMCYTIRLDKAASFAKEHGFDAFTTTLLISPYQKHDLIKELGEKLADKYKIQFYYRDFRPGFRKGQQQAKELGLYRQKYCGCIISLNNK